MNVDHTWLRLKDSVSRQHEPAALGDSDEGVPKLCQHQLELFAGGPRANYLQRTQPFFSVS